MLDDLKRVISDVAAGAADGATALRAVGMPLELDSYTVETRIGSDRAGDATVIRVDFVVGRPVAS